MIGRRIRSCMVVRRNRSFGSGHRCSDWTLLFHIEKTWWNRQKGANTYRISLLWTRSFWEWDMAGLDKRHDTTNGAKWMDSRISFCFYLAFFIALFSLSPRGLLQEKRKTYINVWFKVQTPVHCTYILN